MPKRAHGFRIDESKCTGRSACMRACPTQAIRVRRGKAQLIPELCIDCGSCLPVCPSGAIQATTQSFAEINEYKYKVAVPSPVLFGQFPAGMTPAHIVAGLKALGFDGVWDGAIEFALVNRAIRDYVEGWGGPFPLVSITCPVIVRLIQVLYPGMVAQLVHLQPPRELAGRELKRRYCAELGIHPEEVAAIHITPCQAKTVAILEPAEGADSYLDGALGISDVYNAVITFGRLANPKGIETTLENPPRWAEVLRWATSQSQGCVLRRHRYMSITGLPNVMQVFDDVEKGKLRNIEYLECHACWNGCVSGNLTVDNSYVTLSKIYRLLAELPENDPELEAEVERRYPHVDLSLKGELKPRAVEQGTMELKERVGRMRAEEALLKALPGLDCGLCGSPGCRAFARDVAQKRAAPDECVLFSNDRLEQLRDLYLRDRPPRPGPKS
ncbi:MAG: [Fe-Fe] hydrogenase large subunit C-terminal domain-containing protein [Planctomycetota bacterium]